MHFKVKVPNQTTTKMSITHNISKYKNMDMGAILKKIYTYYFNISYHFQKKLKNTNYEIRLSQHKCNTV